MTNKTHYRKAFNSPYLSSADIVGPTVLTVRKVCLERDKTKKTKDDFNTAYFCETHLRQGEPLKPMILNAHNSKIMRDLCGSHFIEDWANMQVTVYVDPNVRFGSGTVEGLRISPEPPKVKRELTQAMEQVWINAVAAYQRDGNLDKVREKYIVSNETEQLIKKEAAN